jgi:putative Holliday junction resolvase
MVFAMGRMLALDVGAKRIGLAVSDEAEMGATPLYAIERGRAADDAQKIAAVAAAHDVERIVIGLPLDIESREGAAAERVRRFALALQVKTDLPLVFWDERLSTAEAEALLIEADMSRKKRKGRVDALAAARILYSYLRAREREEE